MKKRLAVIIGGALLMGSALAAMAAPTSLKVYNHDVKNNMFVQSGRQGQKAILPEAGKGPDHVGLERRPAEGLYVYKPKAPDQVVQCAQEYKVRDKQGIKTNCSQVNRYKIPPKGPNPLYISISDDHADYTDGKGVSRHLRGKQLYP